MTPTYESHATSCLSLAGFWSLLTGSVPHRNACKIFVSWHLCFDEVIKLSILRSWKTFRCFTHMTSVLYQHCSLINLHITDLHNGRGRNHSTERLPRQEPWRFSQEHTPSRGSGPKDRAQGEGPSRDRNAPGFSHTAACYSHSSPSCSFYSATNSLLGSGSR